MSVKKKYHINVRKNTVHILKVSCIFRLMIRRVRSILVHFKDIFQMHKTASVQYYICMHSEGGMTSSAAIISSTTYFPISTVFN
jgi:hypothetical protein